MKYIYKQAGFCWTALTAVVLCVTLGGFAGSANAQFGDAETDRLFNLCKSRCARVHYRALADTATDAELVAIDNICKSECAREVVVVPIDPIAPTL